MNYLLWANVAIWVGLGGYIAFLGLSQGRISQRLRQLELLDDE